MIVLTMGSDGVLVLEGEHFHHFASKEVAPSSIKSVVGAGDSFLGGLVCGLLND
jgi:sugar/nucleoside kinase (ribokinase family)